MIAKIYVQLTLFIPSSVYTQLFFFSSLHKTYIVLTLSNVSKVSQMHLEMFFSFTSFTSLRTPKQLGPIIGKQFLPKCH